jgi:tape measure domain-containing protein
MAILGTISVALEDDSARFTASMQRNGALVDQQAQRMQKSLGGVATSVDGLNRKASSFQADPFRSLSLSALRAQNSVDRLQKTFLALTALGGGGFTGALAVKSLTDTADRYTNIQNRIASIIPLTRDRATAEQRIFDIAQATRSSFESTAQLYQRLNMSAQALGASQGQILEVTKTLQQSFQVGGVTTAEAASAATQIAQGLAAGTLNGDELRSVLENNAVLAKAIADEFGVSTDQLKKMGAAGELASDRVFKAIIKAGPAINEAFERSTPTFAQAVQVLDNALTRYIGQADKALGVTNAMAQGVIGLANNLQALGQAAATVAPALAILAANRLGQAIGTRAGAGFRAERAVRTDAVLEAEQARDRAAAAAGAAKQAVVDTAIRAQVNPESFAETKILRAREALARQLAAQEAQILAQERKYQVALAAATEAGRPPTSAPVVRAQESLERAQQRAQGTRGTLGLIEASAAATGAASGAKAVDEAQKSAQRSALAFGEAQAVVAQRVAATATGSVALAAATNTVKAAYAGVIGFLGGPIGALLTAAAVGWSLYEVAAARAAAKNEEFKAAGERVIGVLERLREAQNQGVGVAPAITEANRTIGELEAGIARAVQSMLSGLPQVSNQLRGLVPDETQQKLIDLQGKLFDVQRKGGDVTPVMKEIIDALNELGNMNPKFAGIIDGAAKIASAYEDAANKIQQLRAGVGQAQMIGPPIPKTLGAGNELGDTEKEVQQSLENLRKSRVAQAFEAESERKRLVGALTQADLKQAQDDKDRVKELAIRRAEANEEFPTASEEQRARIAESRMSKVPKVPKPKKPKETPEERLSERIARIREEAEVAFMPEADRAVIEEITKRKGGADIAKRARQDLQAGRPLTGELADLRSAQVAKEAAKEYGNIVEKYGNLAQVTPKVRDEQEKLNFLLETGRIDSLQYGLALADTMSKFREFQWIDKLTDSLKSFGDTLADTLYDGKLGADTFAEAANNLGKALFKLVLNQAALEPLANLFKSSLATAFAPGGGGLASLFGGGGGGGLATMAQGGYGPDIPAGGFHGGGLVPRPNFWRSVPASLYQEAPRYAGGLRSGEFAAILHRGEAVLTARQQMGMAAMANSISNMKGGYNVVVNEAPGTQAQVSQGENGGLQIDILSMAEAGLADRMARGRGPLAKASRAGGRSNLRG